MRRLILLAVVMAVLFVAASADRGSGRDCCGQDRAPGSAPEVIDPRNVPGVNFEEAPFARVVEAVSLALDVRIAPPPPEAAGTRVTFQLGGGTASDLRAAFESLCEQQGFAVLGPVDGPLSLVAFRPAAPATEPSPTPRLSVEVAEGVVELVGDRGTVRVRAGEWSAIASDGLPIAPRPIRPEGIAAWRSGPPRDPLPGPPPPPRVNATIALPALEVRLLGLTSGEGRPIIEYSVTGSEQALALGDAVTGARIADIAPRKVVMADGESELIVPVRLRLNLARR
ncbi:MAG: hypothetical protein HYY93_09090 [Planctomycetes bacterium]|nr:hypothetical protein [Planctomycetota bacterium]